MSRGCVVARQSEEATAGVASSPTHKAVMMTPKHYYHTPLKPMSTRACCPVCHQTVYSRAGIHPQCAVVQSDPPRPKAKKNAAPDHADQAVTPAVEPGNNVVVEPAAVEKARASSRPILPKLAGVSGT